MPKDALTMMENNLSTYYYLYDERRPANYHGRLYHKAHQARNIELDDADDQDVHGLNRLEAELLDE